MQARRCIVRFRRNDVIPRIRLVIARSAAVVGILTASAWVQAQTSPAEEARVSALLSASKIKFVKHSSPKTAAWTIDRRSAERGEFQVVVTVKSDLLIVFVTVEQKARIQRTPELDQKLLKMSYKFDFVKIGIDDDDDVFVRIDTHLRLLDSAALVEIVEQVARITDIVYVALKPHLSVKLPDLVRQHPR
jgi:hypothetical protein